MKPLESSFVILKGPGNVAAIRHYGEANLSGTVRRTTYEGRDILVVPVVMLRQTVVHGANADAPALVPLDELMAESWNGVPVTVGHPNDQGAFASANSPEILSKWKIGRIFNAKMEGDKLKAEAWVDIVRANKVKPGLVAMLESGKPMDVSTGYFSRHDATAGTFNGRAYSVMHRDIKPDHLALLPDENGACSWQDGCGVRANAEGINVKKTATAILSALAAALGCGCDLPENIIPKLIADNRAPFGEADKPALEAMSAPVLVALRDKFIPAANEEDDMTDKPKGKVTVNAADLVKTLGVDQATADKMAAAANAAPAMTPEEIAAAKKKAMMDKIAGNSGIAVAVLATLPDAALEAMAAAIKPDAKASALSASDQEALAFARTARDDHRAGLVAKITGNSDMKAEALKDMPLATLETIAAGLKSAAVTANYAGRHVAAANFASEDKVAEAMAPASFADALAAKNGKKKEAA